jgi:hypothetical protein
MITCMAAWRTDISSRDAKTRLPIVMDEERAYVLSNEVAHVVAGPLQSNM